MNTTVTYGVKWVEYKVKINRTLSLNVRSGFPCLFGIDLKETTQEGDPGEDYV